jgi:hypothetical protein
MNLSLEKTTVMSSVGRVNIFSNGEDSSTATNYKLWWFSSPMTATLMKRPRKE